MLLRMSSIAFCLRSRRLCIVATCGACIMMFELANVSLRVPCASGGRCQPADAGRQKLTKIQIQRFTLSCCLAGSPQQRSELRIRRCCAHRTIEPSQETATDFMAMMLAVNFKAEQFQYLFVFTPTLVQEQCTSLVQRDRNATQTATDNTARGVVHHRRPYFYLNVYSFRMWFWQQLDCPGCDLGAACKRTRSTHASSQEYAE